MYKSKNNLQTKSYWIQVVKARSISKENKKSIILKNVWIKDDLQKMNFILREQCAWTVIKTGIAKTLKLFSSPKKNCQN